MYIYIYIYIYIIFFFLLKYNWIQYKIISSKSCDWTGEILMHSFVVMLVY